MASLDASLLHAPAPVGIRTVARVLSDRAAEAHVRLREGVDPEALHDFRVAVRRLRSWLRTFRRSLRGDDLRAARKGLRKVAQATNQARDAEVFAAWLEETRDALTARQKVGAVWLRQQVTRAPATALADETSRDLTGALEKLARELPVYRMTHHLDGEPMEPAFSVALAAAIRRAGERLRRRLNRIDDPHDPVVVHEARIAGKRLRYVLEPMMSHVPGASGLVRELKLLQDTLGDLHDSHVWFEQARSLAEGHLTDEARRLLGGEEDGEHGGTGGPEVRPGLLAVTRSLRKRLREGHTAAVAAWCGPAADPFLSRVTEVVDACRMVPPPDTEIERKYLLLAMPEHWPEGETVFIDQGYLPGEKLVERIRRIRSRSGEQFLRTLKAGTGVARLEVEEETTREVFEATWPLTVGRRVSKRRHRIRDGELTWELDDFSDRELALAEVELPAVDHVVAIPDWLQPVLVREVTGEPDYTNLALAR